MDQEFSHMGWWSILPILLIGSVVFGIFSSVRNYLNSHEIKCVEYGLITNIENKTRTNTTRKTTKIGKVETTRYVTNTENYSLVTFKNGANREFDTLPTNYTIGNEACVSEKWLPK